MLKPNNAVEDGSANPLRSFAAHLTAPLDFNMNTKEENTWRRYFSDCNNKQERNDVIFVYPDELGNNPESITDKLQQITDFLKYVTELNPTEIFQQRVVIGYSQSGLGWSRNRVNIPWKYLNKNDEPIDASTHELVHPFFRTSPLHDANEGWGEGFCDFLRGPAKKIVSLDGNGWWRRMIAAANENKDSEYHYPAGQFVIRAFEKCGSSCGSIESLIDDHGAIKKFVLFLFSTYSDISLSTYIEPSPKMKQKWAFRNKI